MFPRVPAKAGIQRSVPAFVGKGGRIRMSGFVLLGFAALTLAALALAACGRAGPLEPPPGPAAVPSAGAQLTQPDGTPAPGSSQDVAVKSGFDTQGNPVATGQKRPFILDPLLR
jgi:predicted small lipoprotein YifL